MIVVVMLMGLVMLQVIQAFSKYRQLRKKRVRSVLEHSWYISLQSTILSQSADLTSLSLSSLEPHQ